MADGISFEHFVKLLHSISQVKPRHSSSRCTNYHPESLVLVERWLTHLRQYDFPRPRTCQIFFRLFFPEEDIRRRYNLKETTLARTLATDVFRLSTGTHGAGCNLLQWSEHGDRADNTKLGCLGDEVGKVLSNRYSSRRDQSPSIQKIDTLLDELASLSSYSNLEVPIFSQKRPRAAILRDLYLDLDPVEAKFLTQIILKDLRPVLYPLTETHTTRALLHYNSRAVHILTKWEVMRAWNPCMPRVYRARASLDAAADAVEILLDATHVPQDHEAFSPVVGVPIEVPKTQKGVKLSHALSLFRNQSHDVWAETKYDGERMQIHIDLSRPSCQQIKIFSKSKRDSTLDRAGTLPIIRAALNLPPLPEDYSLYPALEHHKNARPAPPMLTSLVLDAEMVCYSESKGNIDEFWRLRSLIGHTAHGVRGRKYHKTKQTYDSQESPQSGPGSPDIIIESLQSNASDNGDRHLKIVFFDVLLLNGSSLLDQDYATRRAQLKSLIHQIPGYVSLSSRWPISLSSGLPAAVKQLAKVFSEHIANHQEGLVLKAAKSLYNDHQLPWVKLKRDYIPGYGDTVDLAVLGAGWNKDRARELRVSPETYTTFWVAALEKPVPVADSAHCAATFQVLSNVEYGMSREQLETFNMYIKASEIHRYCDNALPLSYKFRLPQHLAKPTVMLSRPLLAELFGAGFTKDVGAKVGGYAQHSLHAGDILRKYYTLRFPRFTKVWWANERNWAEAVHLDEFQKIARTSIGRESGEQWAQRIVEGMWGCDADPGPKDPRVIAERSNEWCQKLLMLENIGNGVSGTISGDTRNVSSSSRRKSTGVTMPPAKRQKLRTGRTPMNLVRGLQSMTNLMHMDSSVPQEVWPDRVLCSSTQGTPPANAHNVWNADQHENMISRTVMQVDPASAISESTTKPQLKSGVVCPSVASSLNPSSILSQFPMSTKSVEDVPRARSVPDSLPTSKQRKSSGEGPNDERTFAGHFEHYWPQRYIHTPIVKFLQDAYVWVPRDLNNKRPLSRPPASDLVPQNRRIGVIYFLLIICGCRVYDIQRTKEQFTHVNKCVLFVDAGHDPNMREGLTWLFCALESWRKELNKPGNKELYVFNSSMITYNSLATFHGEVTSQALWRSTPVVEPSGEAIM